MRRRWLWLLLALAVIDALLFLWLFLRHTERRYEGYVREASGRYGVDPALIRAVMWRESAFNAAARGRAGEIGLMQVRSLAAEEWAQAERLKQFEHEHLTHPRSNILAGTWYLSKLIKRYAAADNPLPYALADYNAGRTHVLKWMHNAAATNSGEFLEAMDFPGTRAYIEAVLERYRETSSGHSRGLSR